MAGGEESIVRKHFAPLAAGYPGALGLADDCASISPPPGFDLVIKTDPIREGVHFLADDPPKTIGWKALAVNVSDLVAKGASPHVYTLALSFPELPTDQWLTEFSLGLAEAQRAFGCHLVGGDTDRAPGPLSIAIAAIGLVPRDQMVRRGAAKPGDIVFVSGTLGDAAFGLRIARRDSAATAWPLDRTQQHHLTSRYRRPNPQIELAPILRAHASAAMDISDGLIKDLGRMIAASGVGATVDLASLPLTPEVRAVLAADPSVKPLTWGGGDDYVVLCTVPPHVADAFQGDAGRAGVETTPIGRITSDRKLSCPGFDDIVAAAPGGWDHF